MALSEDLPLYRDSLQLLNRLIPLTQGFPRFFRYGLGNRMVELNLDMLSLIYKVNSSYEKVAVITEFLDKLGKQGTGWKQYNEKGKQSNENRK